MYGKLLRSFCSCLYILWYTACMIRKQRFAGTWYPRDRASLEKITHLDAVEDPKVRFGVVPHAGLFYSAPLIRLFFSALESDIDKLVVIAPSHYFALPSDILGSGSFSAFETPLGYVEGFSLSCFDGGYEEVTAAEHAVEMILPFAVARGKLFLCVAHVNDFTDAAIATGYAEKILAAIDTHTAVLASSDFTHYGINFGYVPYGNTVNGQVEERVREYDRDMAERFCRGEGLSAYSLAKKQHSTICGIAPMLVVSEIARLAGYEGQVAGQADSLEKSGSENNFVSYVTILWRHA